MGIIVKRRGNDKYLYFLYGKKQLYLGRKDDIESIDQAKLLKGTTMLDKSMDMELKKYVENISMCAKYMNKKKWECISCKKKIKNN